MPTIADFLKNNSDALEEIKFQESINSDENSKMIEKWGLSSVKEIILNFTELTSIQSCLYSCLRHTNIKRLAIQHIQADKIEKTLYLVLNFMKQIESIEIGCESIHLSSYPRVGFSITAEG